MIRKSLVRAAVSTVGIALAAGTMSVAPQISLAACDYPDSVATQTTLTLADSVGRYGNINRAYVRVQASDDSIPTGSVP